ncbi:MAG: hypothetical protein GC134_05565 [Proteobacteria bacterium]|nr:hypothetical protein [Pseudomonadota bacterium]
MFRHLCLTALFCAVTVPAFAQVLPKQDEDPNHPRTLRIHFGSPGSGIDRAALQKAINAAEAEMNHFDSYSIVGWGKEGEQTMCIQPKFDETFDSYKKFYDMLAKEGKYVTTAVVRAECQLPEDVIR